MTLQNIAKQSMTKRNRQTTTLGTAVLGGFNGGISRGECFCGIEREREQERERERERARESERERQYNAYSCKQLTEHR